MDPDISRWLLDFLVRQPLVDSNLAALIRTSPLPDTDTNFKKLLLLKKIESEILKGLISDKILVLLEHIEELEYRDEVEVIDSMKRAYCAVAVHCTVRFLQADKMDDYFDAVKRIWRNRVAYMLKYKDVGLISDDLISWKDEIESAVWDDSVCKLLLVRWNRLDVIAIVRAYVKDAKENVGPSFLELVAKTSDEEELRKLFGVDEEDIYKGNVQGKCKQVAAKPHKNFKARTTSGVKFVDNDDLTILSSDNKYGCVSTLEKVTKLHEDLLTSTLSLQEMVAKTLDEEELRKLFGVEKEDIHKGYVQGKGKQVAVKQHKKFKARTTRGVKILNNDDMTLLASDNNYGCMSTPEKVTKLQKDLRTSTLSLQEMVKDSLPEALNVAKNDASNKDSVDRSTKESNLGNKGSTTQSNATIASLMERNNITPTYEWDESSDKSVAPARRPKLATPKGRVVSPLKNYENPGPLRRKRNFWSDLEEDTLRTGVMKYGVGNWKLILSMYRDIFDLRTEVDLKDKWRNMIK